MFLKNRRALILPAFVLTSLAGLALAADDDHKAPSHSDHGKQEAAKQETKASPFKSKSRSKAKAKEAAPAKNDEHKTDEHKSDDHKSDSHAKADEHAEDAHASDAKTSEDKHETPVVTPVAQKASSVSDPANSQNLPEAGSISADDALKLLQEGNARWAADQELNPSATSQRRQSNADDGQRPFVTILTCADSRIPVERVFDRGVGEIFTIRVAGNVAGTSETGTIEYGLGHLKTRLLVVMGHTKCGAVAAACSKAELHGAVGELVSSIQPAVERAQRQTPGADETQLVTASVRENVWQSVYQLLKSEDIRTLVDKGDVKVVGAVYDIASGNVEWLGEHPWQQELVTALNTEARLGSEKSHAITAHAVSDQHAAPADSHDSHTSEHATADEDHK